MEKVNHSVPSHNPAPVTPSLVYDALLTGWNPDKPDQKVGFLKGYVHWLYTCTLGELIERHPRLLPQMLTAGTSKTVGRSEHLMERAFIIAADAQGLKLNNDGQWVKRIQEERKMPSARGLRP